MGKKNWSWLAWDNVYSQSYGLFINRGKLEKTANWKCVVRGLTGDDRMRGNYWVLFLRHQIAPPPTANLSAPQVLVFIPKARVDILFPS